MADRYVSALAAGGGTGTEVDPWTLAEAVTNINNAMVVAGETVWFKADGTYTTAGVVISVSGTSALFKRLEGYTDTIGDDGKATIQRSGGAGILFSCYQNHWEIKNFIFDGQDSGTHNLYMSSYSILRNTESHSAGQIGILGAVFTEYVNCYTHDNGGNGFYGGNLVNCISSNDTTANAAVYRPASVRNSIVKGSTGNGINASSGCVISNCVIDTPDKHGIAIEYVGVVIMNTIIKGTPASYQGIWTNNKPGLYESINFDGCDSISDDIGLLGAYYELGSQFIAPASLDYRRSGKNLDGLGFNEIGLVSGIDYGIDIGPFQNYPDPPAVGNVRDGVTYNYDWEGTLEVPAIGDVRDGTEYGADGDEYEGTMEVTTVESPILLEVEDDAVEVSVVDDRILLEVDDG